MALRSLVRAGLGKSLTLIGFEQHGPMGFVGMVDAEPVLVLDMPRLRNSDPRIGNLRVMVPIGVGPGGECVTRRTGLAQREPGVFTSVYRTDPGVAERAGTAAQRALLELAQGGRLVDWMDAERCSGFRRGWMDGRAGFLEMDAFAGKGVEDRIVETARRLIAAARRIEADHG